jgi:hypothetical protein
MTPKRQRGANYGTEPRAVGDILMEWKKYNLCWRMTIQIYIKLLRNLQRSSLVMAVEADRCINRINMGETNTA